MAQHVAVLLGGWSAEREVSLVSGKAVCQALTERGYRVTPIDAGHDLAARLQELRPDVVFNALHGRWGEDGCIQGLLEVLGIPYTHSGVLASALAMDKPTAKHLFSAVGIPVAEGRVVSRDEVLAGDPLPRPYVIKPLNEGSSVGVSIVFEGDNRTLDAASWHFGEQVLVERYIAGREVQVAVLDTLQGEPEALGAIEIRAAGRFYDYEAKYTDGKAEHILPAPIHPDAYAQALEYAVRAHRVLGCRGLTRSDFRYDDTPERTGKPGTLYILEVNSQPGMTPLSLSPEIAAGKGISFAALVERLVTLARCDYHDSASHRAAA